MTEQARKPEDPLQVEQLGARATMLEVAYGVGIMLGLWLLRLLENVRDGFFRLLDRVNLRPRVRRASAFPPGRPRRHTTTPAPR